MSDINTQVRQLNRTLKQTTGDMQRATSSALNKSADRIKTRVVKGVSVGAKVQQKLIRQRVFIRRSQPKKQMARVSAYRRDIPIISMKARELKRGGVTAQGGRRFNHAFIADGRKGFGRYQKGSGYQSTSLRADQALQRTGNDRYPIEVIKVEIAPYVDRITPTVAHRVMKNDYPKLLKHEIEYRIQRRSQS